MVSTFIYEFFYNKKPLLKVGEVFDPELFLSFRIPVLQDLAPHSI